MANREDRNPEFPRMIFSDEELEETTKVLKKDVHSLIVNSADELKDFLEQGFRLTVEVENIAKKVSKAVKKAIKGK